MPTTLINGTPGFSALPRALQWTRPYVHMPKAEVEKRIVLIHLMFVLTHLQIYYKYYSHDSIIRY